MSFMFRHASDTAVQKQILNPRRTLVAARHSERALRDPESSSPLFLPPRLAPYYRGLRMTASRGFSVTAIRASRSDQRLQAPDLQNETSK